MISTNDMVISDKDRLFNKIRPTSSSSSSMPSISIDSSSLGGMYANKINIIATKDGVGVNNAGIISASKISINANGDIINLNTIKAKDELQLNSAKTISNQDSALISSSNDMSLFAGFISNLTNSNIIAANHLNIKANNLNNFSQSVIKTRFEQYTDVLNLTCGSCGDRTFDLSVDMQTIKDEIINEWELANKSYNSEMLSKELFERVVLSDATLYALNLHTKNLILESLRDRYTSNEKGMGIGAGIGFSGDQTT
ncbi:hypothetical protein CCAL12920_03270 [Campylobacter sp. RM12920]|uniref:Uncharacterized protein n=1 Tax=Campylobacter californiensis TaxID=1032243 RepID=A0ABD4JGA3_9BACT|nr:hypothetical protein [Campylobacter sp. RM12919]MBE2987919.1 hypothetical protein [Campylobacter sp. RM12920]